MKHGKKFLATMIVAVVAGYNVYQSQSKVVLSELALANVEALANKVINNKHYV